MRLRIALLLLGVAALGVLVAIAPWRDEREPWQYAIRVDVVTCDGRGTGSAFAASPTTLVTNRHVVEEAVLLEPMTWDGEGLPVDGKLASRQADIAVIRLRRPTEGVLEISDADPVPGDKVVAVGYPKGGPAVVGRGRIVDYIDGEKADMPDKVIRAEVDETEPGSSGGPLLAEDGRVIGLVFAIELRTGFTLAIPASALTDALDDQSAMTPVDVDC